MLTAVKDLSMGEIKERVAKLESDTQTAEIKDRVTRLEENQPAQLGPAFFNPA